MENESILKEWFERVDSEKTGSITATQLKNALSVGNLEFTISAVQQMIRMYDFDRNGTMSFKGSGSLLRLGEALLKIGFSLDYPAFYTVCENHENRNIIHEAHIQKSGVHKIMMRVTHSFDYQVSQSQVDEYTVSFFDLYKDLRSDAAYRTESLYCNCFMLSKSFDQKKNGRFLLDDFISLCIFVHSARNLFNSFDTSKQGRVTLEFNQFIYCTANCRI